MTGNVFYGENQHRERNGKIQTVSCHAEMNVILKWLKTQRVFSFKSNLKCKNATIYVARIPTRSCRDHFGCSKPCELCEKLIFKYGIKKIKYTTVIDGKTVVCEMKRVEM